MTLESMFKAYGINLSACIMCLQYEPSIESKLNTVEPQLYWLIGTRQNSQDNVG